MEREQGPPSLPEEIPLTYGAFCVFKISLRALRDGLESLYHDN